VKAGCARQRVAPATLNCTSSRNASSQSRAAEPARRREPLTASWRGGYQRYIRTLNLTNRLRGLTVCQRKFQFLHIIIRRRTLLRKEAATEAANVEADPEQQNVILIFWLRAGLKTRPKMLRV
jgi:hypothetical protein